MALMRGRNVRIGLGVLLRVLARRAGRAFRGRARLAPGRGGAQRSRLD